MFKRGPKEPVVTIFYVTDLHGSQVAYRKFLNAAQAYGVKALICGGDVAGKQMYPIVPDASGVKSVELDGRVHRLDSAEALAEAKSAIGSRGGYDVELDREEADRLAEDEAGRDELFTRLVQKRLAEWIELAEERLSEVRHQALCHRRQRRQRGDARSLLVDAASEHDHRLGGPRGRRLRLSDGQPRLEQPHAVEHAARDR